MDSENDQSEEGTNPLISDRRGWLRRNPALAGSCATAIVILAIGAAVYTELSVRLSRAQSEIARLQEDADANRRQVEAAIKREEAARRSTEVALRETEAAINHYVATVANAQLLNQKENKPLREKLLKDALAHYQRFVQEHQNADDEKTKNEIADALKQIERISSAISKTKPRKTGRK